MKMVIKNEFGSFELGGGCNSSARMQSIVGLGLPTKESERINFSGQAGQLTKSVRDLSRTITVAFDFNGGQREIERLYKILYYPVELLFTFGTRRRKISARCINPQEVESIMYQNLYRYAIQFVCDNPYFSDFYNTNIAIFNRENQFPNVSEGGKWYVQLPAVATIRTTTANITNNGELVIYPIIHIHSLGSDISGIKITNETTGAKIMLEHSPADGEEITIDLASRKITSNISGNIINSISDDTDLSKFFLELGNNKINCEILAGSGNLSVVIEYTNNYAMAVVK